MGTLSRRQMTSSAFLFLFQLAQANPCQQEGCTGCFLDKVFPDHSSSSGILISNGSNFEIFPAELNCDIPPLKPEPEGEYHNFLMNYLTQGGKNTPFRSYTQTSLSRVAGRRRRRTAYLGSLDNQSGLTSAI